MVFVHHFKGYKICYSKNAERDLKHIEKSYASKIKQKFEEITAGMPNVDIKRLQGKEHHRFRLRIGTYRAVFEVNEKTITILVISVAPRGDIYD